MNMYTITCIQTETGETFTQAVCGELPAVLVLEQMALYSNLQPVAVVPEPDWGRYPHGQALRDALAQD
jgi:hypothetical protein